MGSGTTLFECEKLNKNIGFDINPTMLDYVNNNYDIDSSFENNFYINYCNSLDSFEVNQKNIEKKQMKFNKKCTIYLNASTIYGYCKIYR